MDNKTNTYQTTNLTVRFKYLLVFSILLSALGGFQTAQAAQWRVFTTANSPLPSNLPSTIVADRNNVKWIGSPNGMVRIDGNNWMIYDSTNTPFADSRISPGTIDASNNLWVMVYSKGLAKFDGLNWTVYDTNNSGMPSNYIMDIKVDEQNVKWIGTGKGFVKFNDVTWVVYDTNNSGLPKNNVSAIAIENHVKWAGTFTLTGGMAKFNDTNWVVYNTTNSGIPSNTIWDIEIDNWGVKWIGTHFGGVGKYNSLLNSWTVYNPQNSGLPDAYVLCVLPQNSLKWFGTQGGGLAKFNDTNWIVYNPSNSPIPSYSIRSLALDSLGNLWIGTAGGLVIYNENGIIGIKNVQNKVPNAFTLYQNFPNPFNPVTNIKYQIENNNASVKLNVYDITGKKIVALVNQKQNTGLYTVSFNGENLPSGIYFYKLQTETYSETKKMVLIK